MATAISIKKRGDLYEQYEGSHRLLNKRWTELCELYLPVGGKDSMWRYSRQSSAGDPSQGWKLHITATVLTASRVLDSVAPFLHKHKVLFKAPSSLKELSKINSGVYYGYSQVGKFITVYPRTNKEAALLARKIHKLTYGMPAPSVPYDLKYRYDSCVYYRYGAFKFHEVEAEGGELILALRDEAGELVPDIRNSATAKPDWVPELFPTTLSRPKAIEAESPLKTIYRAFGALSQRGKGGVYRAFDFSTSPPRPCILKEGRINGEVCLDGRDGYCRIRHEESVLKALRGAGVRVPLLYSAFKAEKSYFLALEFVEGETLERWLGKRTKRLSLRRVLQFGAMLSGMMSRIHAAGWVWRDCKPGNIIVTTEGELRPLDFEGACSVSQPDPVPWGTPPFIPPEWTDEFRGQSRLPEDLYALGAIIYLMLAGCAPDGANLLPIENLRRAVPIEVRGLVTELLDANPERRPRAREVERRLQALLATNEFSSSTALRLKRQD